MSLDSTARRRYARHLLLGEIGEAGQERLLETSFRRGAEGDDEAYAVAAEYLERAGCRADGHGEELQVLDAGSLSSFAGTPALRAPAATVAGAFAAVEHIKRVLGVGSAARFPPGVTLSGED